MEPLPGYLVPLGELEKGRLLWVATTPVSKSLSLPGASVQNTACTTLHGEKLEGTWRAHGATDTFSFLLPVFCLPLTRFLKICI